MKSFKVFFAVSMLLFALLSACSFEPQSKEAYLDQFKSFVDNVGESYKDYDDKTWEKKDAQFSKYTDEWYLKFKDELNISEKITVKKLAVKYALYRGGEDLKGGLKEGIEALKEIGEAFLEILEENDSDNIEVDIRIE